MGKPASVFKKGDKVAWDHGHAIYAGGAVLRVDALEASAILGKVRKVANDKGTHFEVDCDDGERRVLTFEELVKVADE